MHHALRFSLFFFFFFSTLSLLLDLDYGPENFEVTQLATTRGAANPSGDAGAASMQVQGDGEKPEDIKQETPSQQGDSTDLFGSTPASEITGEVAEQASANSTFASHSAITDKLLIKNTHKKRKLELEKQLEKVLIALFFAASSPFSDAALSEEAKTLILQISTHFAILKSLEAAARKRGDAEKVKTGLDTDVFVNAIVSAASSEQRELAGFVEKALLTFHQKSQQIFVALGMPDFSLPFYDVLATKFSSCCHEREWFYKAGGCLGISILSSKLELGVKWLMNHELKFARALLFVLKDNSQELNVGVIEDTNQTFMHLLKVCNKPGEDTEGDDNSTKLAQELVKILVTELHNPNGIVRETVQSSLTLLASLPGNEVSELLEPYKDRILQQIFQKSFRALPIANQIGFLDAITYCLTLRPPLLKFDVNLMKFLMDALAIAEEDDQVLMKKTNVKTAQALSGLRISSIELLSAAMSCQDFQNQQETIGNMKVKIIGIYFKYLSPNFPEIVEVAKKGLSQIVTQQKLPRDLLQASLRPVLLNLAEHKKLDVPSLQSLARLLELLTSCFNLALGEKLLEHLQKSIKLLIETQSQPPQNPKPVGESKDVQLTVAIMDVFYLLPNTAIKFLENLVKSTIQLEASMKRYSSSPFRSPLTKFLNKYPTESVDYFYQRLNDAENSKLFTEILETEAAAPLRKEIHTNTEKLETTLDLNLKAPQQEIVYQAIVITKIVAENNPTWLSESPALMKTLEAVWKLNFQANKEGSRPFGHLREPRYLLECFVQYCKSKPKETDLLFVIAQAFLLPNLIDITFVRRFFQQDVAMNFSVEEKSAIIKKFFAMFRANSEDQPLKTKILQQLIMPILIVSCRNGYVPLRFSFSFFNFFLSFSRWSVLISLFFCLFQHH